MAGDARLLKIYLTSTEPANTVVAALAAAMGKALAILAPRYATAESPEAADAILFIESGANKFRDYARVLKARREVAERVDRCFVSDFTDQPVVFLPGLYHSLPRSRFDLKLCRAVPAWGPPPESTFEAVLAETEGVEPTLLFSFRGSRSAEVRSHLFKQSFAGVECSIVETTRWWDYAEEEPDRLEYLREIRRGRFALAPRGRGASTSRLYEIMRLGRAPVILSDDWVPPVGIPWHDFAVRVGERRVADLPAILGELEPWAEEMGVNARLAWERHCAPGPVLMRRLAQELEDLALTLDGSEAQRLADRWLTARFAWEQGWHPAQKLASALRRGTIVGDVRRRVSG